VQPGELRGAFSNLPTDCDSQSNYIRRREAHMLCRTSTDGDEIKCVKIIARGSNQYGAWIDTSQGIVHPFLCGYKLLADFGIGRV